MPECTALLKLELTTCQRKVCLSQDGNQGHGSGPEGSPSQCLDISDYVCNHHAKQGQGYGLHLLLCLSLLVGLHLPPELLHVRQHVLLLCWGLWHILLHPGTP